MTSAIGHESSGGDAGAGKRELLERRRVRERAAGTSLPQEPPGATTPPQSRASPCAAEHWHANQLRASSHRAAVEGRRRDRAPTGRSSLFFSRHRRTIIAAMGGRPGLSVSGSAGSSCRTAFIVSTAEPRLKARARVNISHSTAPSEEDVGPMVQRPAEHLFRRHVAGRPEHDTRFAEFAGGLLRLSLQASFGQFCDPEIEELDAPSVIRNALAGLTSRCQAPARAPRRAPTRSEWRSRPPFRCTGPRSSRARSVSPSSSSVTTHGVPLRHRRHKPRRCSDGSGCSPHALRG